MNDYLTGRAPGPLDTIAVGTGTGAEDPTATSLQSEIGRWASSDSVVTFVPDSGDNTIVYAIVELTGGLEIPSGTEVTEVGVFTTATTPETLVWYDVNAPAQFPSGVSNELRIPMNFDRVTS